MARERMIPPIHADTRVSPDTAMVDRFELEVGPWRAIGTRSAIATRLSMLTDHEVDSARGERVQFFKKATFQDVRWKHTLEFRGVQRGKSAVTLHPLASGRLVGKMRLANGTGENAEMFCTLRLEATLNATRFLQAHEFARLRRYQRPQTNGVIPLAIAQRDDWWRNERPLEVSDNLIIGKWLRYHFALSRPVEVVVAEYVNAVVSNLTQAMVDRELLLEDPGLNRSNNPPEYRLGDIEIYWEFDHDNPIAFVDVLTHYLSRTAQRMRITRRRLKEAVRQVSQQSQSATIYLTRKRELRVYAKTNRRVRFEVGFPDGYITARERSATFDNVRDLAEEVATLKREAADTLNGVLENLWEDGGPEEFDFTPEHLRNLIARAAGNPFDATTITEMLTRHGRVSLQKGDGLRSAVRWLATRRYPVLTTLDTDRNTYVVTPPYEYARRNLDSV